MANGGRNLTKPKRTIKREALEEVINVRDRLDVEARRYLKNKDLYNAAVIKAELAGINRVLDILNLRMDVIAISMKKEEENED